MKIGIFDSGIGGLIITKAIKEKLPEYDMVYLGDTLHLPYGGRSKDAIYCYTERAIDYLLSKENCNLVVIACNTASATALRRIQQEYLVKYYPKRRVLGVVIPTLETVVDKYSNKRIGLLATEALVNSGIYQEELQKLAPHMKIFAKVAPLLVPLIENGGEKWLSDVLQEYLKPLLDKNIDVLVLACTHYPFLIPYLKEILPPNIAIVSQDRIIPDKLDDYLTRHPEIDKKLNKNSENKFCVTDITNNYIKTAKYIYGRDIKLEKVVL